MNGDSLRRAAGSEEYGCTIFLGGPFIDPDDQAQFSDSVSSKLRFELFHRLSSKNWVISLGEYRELINASAGALGEINNSAAAEIAHARDVADVVVMIVDSPGSFAEIGAFSMIETVCSKMLILSDQKYKENTGYVATGPVLMSKAFGAEVEYLDFCEFDHVENIVSDFVHKVMQKRALKAIVKT